MKKYLKIISLYALALIIFLAFFKFFLQGKELFEKIRNIEIFYLLPQIILAFLSGLTTAYMNAIILKSFNIYLKFKEWFGLGCVNTLSNFLFPMKTGSIVKALYLKNKYDFCITHSLSILLFATFIKFEVDFFLTALLLGYARLTSLFLSPYLNLLLYFSCVMFPSGIVFLLIMQRINLVLKIKRPFLKRILDKFILLIDGMNLMSKNFRLLIMITLLSVVTFIIQIFSLYFAYMAIEKTLPLFNIAFVSLLTSISELVSITPSNLGIREVVISFSSQAIGCTIEEGFVVSAIIRVAAIAVFLILGIVFLILLRGSLSKQSREDSTIC